MVRCLGACGVCILGGLLLLPAHADDEPRLKSLFAFEEAMQQAIKRAEPAIACILVSRSDYYRKRGDSPPPDYPGKLGGFELRFGNSEAEKEHDLAACLYPLSLLVLPLPPLFGLCRLQVSEYRNGNGSANCEQDHEEGASHCPCILPVKPGDGNL